MEKLAVIKNWITEKFSAIKKFFNKDKISSVKVKLKEKLNKTKHKKQDFETPDYIVRTTDKKDD